MWRPILICLSLGILVNCTPIITCDPTESQPDCPSTHPICDPTGICRQTCTGNVDCKDPGTICDKSSRTASPICQTSCNPGDGNTCPTGQHCYAFSIPPVTIGGSSIELAMCKADCLLTQSNPFCHTPYQCSAVGANPLCIGKPCCIKSLDATCKDNEQCI